MRFLSQYVKTNKIGVKRAKELFLTKKSVFYVRHKDYGKSSVFKKPLCDLKQRVFLRRKAFAFSRIKRFSSRFLTVKPNGVKQRA